MPRLLQRFNILDTRHRARPAPPIRTGTRDDYGALARHHYRAGSPLTMTRVLVIDDDAPSAADRYLGRAPRPRPAAVLVESLPVLSCVLREHALGGRYAHLPPGQRSRLLTDELRCISRVVVDPRWRGLGLAVRLVRHALATAATRYTEALAVMGRVSPFFERAGMTAYRRPPLPVDERATAALRYAGLEPRLLALPDTLIQYVDAMPQRERAWLVRELTRWYRANGGRGIKRTPPLHQVLTAARQRLLAQPVYYLHENTHAEPR